MRKNKAVTRYFKRNISIFLTIIMMLSSFSSVSAEQLDIYIGTAEELAEFSKKCVDESYSVGKTFIITADIDLSGVDFSPIPVFGGTFNGGFHTISGLEITGKSYNDGFFRYLTTEASVKNVTIEAYIEPEGSKSVIGILVGQNEGTIDNCAVKGFISGNDDVGGIAGINTEIGIIKNSTNEALVKGSTRTGGIAGKNEGTIEKCENRGIINNHNEASFTDTGGIVGWSSGTINGSKNYGEIGYQNNGYNVGGIAGLQGGIILQSENYGLIQGRKDIGGIAGQFDPYITFKYGEGMFKAVLDEFSILIDILKDMSGTLSDSTTEGVGNVQNLIDDIDLLIETIGDAGSDSSEHTLETLNTLHNNILELSDVLDNLSYDIDNFSASAYKDIGDITEGIDIIGQSVNEGLSNIDDEIREHGGNIDSSLDNIRDDLEDAHSGLDNITDEFEEARDTIQYGYYGYTYPGYSVTILDDTPISDALNTIYDLIGSISLELQEITGSIESILARLREAQRQISEAERIMNNTIMSVSEKMYQLDVIVNSIRQIDIASDADNISNSITSIGQEMDQINENIEYLYKGISDASEEMAQGINKGSDIANDAINSLNGALKDLSDSTTENMRSLNQILRIISNTSNEYFNESNDRREESSTKIKEQGDSIHDRLNGIGDSILDTNEDLSGITEQLRSQLETIIDTFNNIESPEFTVDDISDNQFNESLKGQIAFSSNHNKVLGDINVGGVVGNVAREFYEDPEEEWNIGDNLAVDTTALIRATVWECKNTGYIEAKYDYAGGIIGQSKYGAVAYCINTGDIKTVERDYCGGIAGNSVNIIRDSYSLTRLNGNSYVGGIAGMGKDIYRCYAMTHVESDSEKIGAIAGDIDLEGTIFDNYFLRESLGGIDGVNFAGKTIPMDYDEFLKIESLPAKFTEFNVSFIADGETIKVIESFYGGSISAEEIPSCPEKEGFLTTWSAFDPAYITRSIYVEAEHIPLARVLSSGEAQPVMLAEGIFSPDAYIIVENSDISNITIPDNYNVENAYNFKILNNDYTQDEISLRIRTGSKADTIGIIQDGQVIIADCSRDGSYLVFTASDNNTIVVLSRPLNIQIIIVITVVALVLIIALLSLVKIKKRKNFKINNQGGESI